MLRILLAVTALLIYGSLYPWHFHAGRPGGPVHELLHSWQFTLDRFMLRDVALNIAIYIPFGAAAYLWLSARAAAVRFLIPILLAGVLSTSIELAQFFDARRFTSLVDVATNVGGAMLGIALAIPLARKRKSGSRIQIAQPGALLLFGCWALSMLFPLIPDLSRTHLLQKLLQFFSGAFAPVPTFALFAMWLIAARMLSVATGEGSAGIVFPLLGLFLPARFLTGGLTADWPYWASFAAAWLIWMACFSGPRRHDSALVWLPILSVGLTGLAPFHLRSTPQPFSWVPFRALFSTEWETGFSLFLRKAFLYGSIVWLLRQTGWRPLLAAASTAFGLAIIEAVQVYLPNHVAEITDPLMALLLAWILHRLSRAPSLK